MDPRLTDVLVKLAVAIMGVLAALIEVYGLKLVKGKWDGEQVDRAVEIAQAVVHAVEGLAVAGGIDYKAKFAEALKRAKDLAAGKGLVLTDEQWKTFIEAAVVHMKAMGVELHKRVPAA